MKVRRILVIGIGQFGEVLIRELAGHGCEVIAVDRDDERIADVKDDATQALVLDATDEKLLASLAVADMDAVVIGIGQDLQASTLVALLCKEAGAKHLTAKAATRLHGKVLEKIGVDRVVYPEAETGRRLARMLASANLLEQVEICQNASIAELRAPEEFWDKSLNELHVRTAYGVNIIAIKRARPGAAGLPETLEQFPAGDDVVLRDDILLVFGDNARIEALRQLVG